MSNKLVMRNWLLLGAGLGAYGAITIFVRTDGNLLRALAGIALCLVLSIIGGTVTIVSQKNRTSYSPRAESRPRWLVLLAVTLLVVGGVVQAASGPPFVYLALGGFAIVLFIGAACQGRRGH